MTRNDTILYSGLNSASQDKPLKQTQAEEHLVKQSLLISGYDVVKEEIDKEKQRLGEILLSQVDSTASAENVRQHLEAVRLHRSWLQNLENRLATIMRAKPLEKTPETTND